MEQWELALYRHEQLAYFTHYELSTSISANYIVDRTIKDVERWRKLRDKGWNSMTEDERREWLGEITPKPSATRGMYTYRELNRVERSIEFLTVRLRTIGYPLANLKSIKTDWTYSDKFTYEEMERYLYNISVIRECLIAYLNVPEVPSIDDPFDYESANTIEKILAAVDDMSGRISEPRYFVGDLFLGEV